jgi:hypothetical protein
MKKSKTKGLCAYCKKEVNKNARSIMNHISSCDVRNKKKSAVNTHYLLLLLEGAYAPDYWIVIKAKHNSTMQKIDTFIKDIWVECCGHLSAFSYGTGNIAFSKRLADVFVRGVKVNYMYDFGTPTEICISLLGEFDDSDKKDIIVLFRNKEIQVNCSYCDNKAINICPDCIYEEAGLLCESCTNKHRCVKENGEDYLLPLVNSPRAGECGYTGQIERYIKKYFPVKVI